MFLTYLFLGFTIALPIGAISIEMIKQGLKHGFLHSWMIGIGAIIVDVILIFSLNMGLADVLNKFQMYLWLLGALFLLHLGWQSIKSNSLSTHDSELKKESLSSLFKKGLMIGLNPGNIVFWMSVLGTSISSASTNTDINIIAVSVAILLGIVLHDVVLAFLTSKFNRFMTPVANHWVSVLAGILLIGFAFYFFSEFLNEASLF